MHSTPTATPSISLNVEVKISKTNLRALLDAMANSVGEAVERAMTTAMQAQQPEKHPEAQVAPHVDERRRQEVSVSSPVDAQGLDLLLNTREVAKLLKMGRRSIWAYSNSGQILKPIKIGRMVRWRRDELIAWLNAGHPTHDQWVKMRGAVGFS